MSNPPKRSLDFIHRTEDNNVNKNIILQSSIFATAVQDYNNPPKSSLLSMLSTTKYAPG